uniref:RRM domain-containing protein n=1 Tax=Parascaris univalens TaxID=6257 RepID=A0A915A6G9_PARUN
MFSPIYSAGGVYVPHPMFMPLQGGAGTSRGLPIFPPVGPHAFPLAPCFPPGHMPRVVGHPGNSAQLNGEGPPQLRKLFIGGLSHETTDEQLRLFYSQWGNVVDCIVIRDPQTKYSRGFGFVTFATMQMAEAAMADRPHTINNKVVDPKRAIPREQMSPMLPNHPPPFLEGEPDPGCKLSLSGIHWEYHTVDVLRHYFDTFGVVEQVEILGNPRGFGFVVFEEKCAADRCLAHGKVHMINGKNCEVTQNPIQHSVYQRVEAKGDDSSEAAVGDDENATSADITPELVPPVVQKIVDAAITDSSTTNSYSQESIMSSSKANGSSDSSKEGKQRTTGAQKASSVSSKTTIGRSTPNKVELKQKEKKDASTKQDKKKGGRKTNKN